MPHKVAVRETSQITKVRLVWEASAKSSQCNISLNDYLETEPLQQNLLWDTLIRTRFWPELFGEDIQKVFRQIQIIKAERNALSFH